MSTNGRRILVCLDGSDHAMDTVRYVSGILPRRGIEVTLFCVLSKDPEYFLDVGGLAARGEERSDASRWEVDQKKFIEKFMETARQLMLEQGFSPEGVKVVVQEKKVGIARDIISEAQNGYDAVVAGRQGVNPITRLVIGSIAIKLLQSLTSIPFWLVGKTNPSNKILAAVDASEGSMRAVEHIARVVGGSKIEVTLLRVIRGPLSNDELTLDEIFQKASQLLEKGGIIRDQISTKVVSGVATRSGSIIAQATSGGYGTVVLGRRGHTKVEDFYMGRVTNKVIQLGGKVAVWVVN